MDLETKRPRVRGPSGALASLGFARGCSLDVFEEENTAGGNPSERGEDGGSMYDGGSEAGSRYTPSRPAASGSAVGSARQAEVRERASFCVRFLGEFFQVPSSFGVR